jgi:hypothetical protein
MDISGKAADRLVSIVIYVGFGGLALWAGTALINHSLDLKFYKDFVLKWEVALCAYSQKGGPWPHFSGGNHVQYMDQLSSLMSNIALSPPLAPASNTNRPYVYRLDKIGYPQEDIFLLCFSHKIILYGVSAETFARLDSRVDGKIDTENGLLTARPGKDGHTYVGQWQI